MKTLGLAALMAPGPHHTVEAFPADCWYTAPQQSQPDVLAWFGQLAEQQLTQGKHFLLYSPDELSFLTIAPWTELMQDDRIQYLMYRRNSSASQETVRSERQSRQCAWLTTSCWELLWPFRNCENRHGLAAQSTTQVPVY